MLVDHFTYEERKRKEPDYCCLRFCAKREGYGGNLYSGDSLESKTVELIFQGFLNKSCKQISIRPRRWFQKEISSPLGALSFQEFPENFTVVSVNEVLRHQELIFFIWDHPRSWLKVTQERDVRPRNFSDKGLFLSH